MIKGRNSQYACMRVPEGEPRKKTYFHGEVSKK